MAFEDPAGLLLGVVVGARVGVEFLGARLAAQLGDRHPVEDRVHAPVAARVVAVADRAAGTFGGRRGERRGAVEARKAAVGESSRIADLDQQLGDGQCREAAELVEGGAAGLDQRGQLTRDLLVLGVELGDLGSVATQRSDAQRMVGTPSVW